jgi:hypothetical protein
MEWEISNAMKEVADKVEALKAHPVPDAALTGRVAAMEAEMAAIKKAMMTPPAAPPPQPAPAPATEPPSHA